MIVMRFHHAAGEVQAPAYSPHALRFVVGQNRQGRWLAIETHGFGGGIFRNQDEALRFAEFETDWRPGAVSLTTANVELFAPAA